jgi:hypothetical protein
LKELQLIQILRIKAFGAVAAAEIRPETNGVNQGLTDRRQREGGIRQRGYRLSG